MDDLINKRVSSFDYISRYTGVPYYFNTRDRREQQGIGKNMLKTTNSVAHKVLPTDTLDSLALTYYNNPTYWWIIAYFNDIQDSFIKLSDYYTTLNIPPINSVRFGDLR